MTPMLWLLSKACRVASPPNTWVYSTLTSPHCIVAVLLGFTEACNEAYVATVRLKKPKDSKNLEQSLEMQPDDAMEFFEVCDM